MPSGRDGFVVLDLDMLLRWYGPSFGLDEKGMVAHVEVKYGDSSLTQGQVHTLRLQDWLMRGIAGPRYRGCYLIHDYGDGTYRFGASKERIDEGRLVEWAELKWEAPALFAARREVA